MPYYQLGDLTSSTVKETSRSDEEESNNFRNSKLDQDGPIPFIQGVELVKHDRKLGHILSIHFQGENKIPFHHCSGSYVEESSVFVSKFTLLLISDAKSIPAFGTQFQVH